MKWSGRRILHKNLGWLGGYLIWVWSTGCGEISHADLSNSSQGMLLTNPTGFLDRADGTAIAGWARDDDFAGPIQVHIYVDGQMVQGLWADLFREDVGQHAFHFNPPYFGPGNHQVRAYALGVDSDGNLDGINPELNNSPRSFSEPEEYPLLSLDGQITVVVNARFGGGISEIRDRTYLSDLNLIVGDHGGALMQSAFWINPRHAELPPGCPDRSDCWFTNPTQGGYYADVISGQHLGNPIGRRGNGPEAPFDFDEFIRYEDDGMTVHLKSRFIRHDYCLDPVANMDNQQLWDTEFLIEQWIFFDPRYSRTLALKSQVSFVGLNDAVIRTRQLPILFARHLPRAAFWKNNQKVILPQPPPDDQPINPDTLWAAIIAQSIEAGIGYVAPPTTEFHDLGIPTGAYGYGFNSSNSVTTFFLSNTGSVNLESFGKVVNMEYEGSNFWRIHPGGFFEWTLYFPIDALSNIKTTSDQIHATGFCSCFQKECGEDGCGESCGTCLDHFECQNGQCQCSRPTCGENCCAPDDVCIENACCQPDCGKRICGPDPQCQVSCGNCPDHQDCDQAGQCVPEACQTECEPQEEFEPSHEMPTGESGSDLGLDSFDFQQDAGAQGDPGYPAYEPRQQDFEGGCGCQTSAEFPLWFIVFSVFVVIYSRQFTNHLHS